MLFQRTSLLAPLGFAARRILPAVALALGVAGCPDPQGEYDKFAERDQNAIRPPPPKGECGETVDEVEGEFLFALSAKISKNKPLLYLAKITTEDDGLHVGLTPLSAADRKTPVGPEQVLPGGFPIDDKGNVVIEIEKLVAPGKANGINGADLEAQVTLSGTACEELICGNVTGQVKQPSLKLDGSTFTMTRVTGPDDYPEPPPINCVGDEAAPL